LAGGNSLSGGINAGGQFLRAGLVEVARFSTDYCINGSACATNVPVLMLIDDEGDGGLGDGFMGTVINTGPGS
jgi:hypothetical protein